MYTQKDLKLKKSILNSLKTLRDAINQSDNNDVIIFINDKIIRTQEQIKKIESNLITKESELIISITTNRIDKSNVFFEVMNDVVIPYNFEICDTLHINDATYNLVYSTNEGCEPHNNLALSECSDELPQYVYKMCESDFENKEFINEVLENIEPLCSYIDTLEKLWDLYDALNDHDHFHRLEDHFTAVQLNPLLNKGTL